MESSSQASVSIIYYPLPPSLTPVLTIHLRTLETLFCAWRLRDSGSIVHSHLQAPEDAILIDECRIHIHSRIDWSDSRLAAETLGAILQAILRQRDLPTYDMQSITNSLLTCLHHGARRTEAGRDEPLHRVVVYNHYVILHVDVPVEMEDAHLVLEQQRPRCRLGRMRYEKEEGEEELCVICLEELSDWELITWLPCLHVFHCKCLGRWLARSDSCPCCRRAILHVHD